MKHPPGDEQVHWPNTHLKGFGFFVSISFSLRIPNNPQGILKMGRVSSGFTGSPMTLVLSQSN